MKRNGKIKIQRNGNETEIKRNFKSKIKKD